MSTGGARRSGADRRVRDLVESHQGGVAAIAREYTTFGIPFEDLLSEGNVGLIEAACRFEPERGVQFLTYASWWIRKRILNLIARQKTLVRLPRHVMRRLRVLRLAEAALSQRLGRHPSLEELAVEAGLPVPEIEALIASAPREQPLEGSPDDDRSPVIALVPDPHSEIPSNGILATDVEEWIAGVLASLPERERTVLQRRYGFDDEPPETLQKIGDRLGLTRERVRQIEARALDRVRRAIEHSVRGPVLP